MLKETDLDAKRKRPLPDDYIEILNKVSTNEITEATFRDKLIQHAEQVNLKNQKPHNSLVTYILLEDTRLLVILFESTE